MDVNHLYGIFPSKLVVIIIHTLQEQHLNHLKKTTMDLSRKTIPYHLPPPPTPLAPSTPSTFPPNFPTEVKGEYIEEDCDMIKHESTDIHAISQVSNNQHLTPPPQPSQFLSITPSTPSLHSSRMPFAFPFYPHSRFIPRYPTMYTTMTYPLPPLPPLQSLQHFHAQAFQATKRKTSSSPKSAKKLKDVIKAQPTLLSDTRNQKLPQNQKPKPIKSTFCENHEKLQNKVKPTSKKLEQGKATKVSEPSVKDQNDESNSSKSTIDCPVCGDIAIAHFHYGGMCCYSCKAFFRRVVNTYKVSFFW